MKQNTPFKIRYQRFAPYSDITKQALARDVNRTVQNIPSTISKNLVKRAGKRGLS